MKTEGIIISSFRKAEPPVREEFLDSLTPGNLRRMCWFIAIYFPISLGLLLQNLLVMRVMEVISWSIFDLVLAVVFFCLAYLGNRRAGLHGPKRWLVRLYYSYCLISMTGYYFSIIPHFGDNSAFVLGVLMASLIFRLPPREFLPLLLVNQLIFVVGVLQLHRERDFTFAALVFGFDAFFLGILGAWTLFANDWRNFQQKRALEYANRELRQQAENQNELMALTAHDLASPLDNMQMLFGVLLKTPEWTREPYREVLESSRHSISPMQTLISRLLEAHAVENPPAAPLLRSIDLQARIDRCLAAITPSAEAKRIRVLYNQVPLPARVVGDITSTERVLENLLTNAVKFASPDSIVEIQARVEGSSVIVDILDEGPGVRTEDRQHLFRKFYKTENKPTGGEPSFGIGLFIVSKLMMTQGGFVTYEPRVPRGSIFRLTFLSAESREQAAAFDLN